MPPTAYSSNDSRAYAAFARQTSGAGTAGTTFTFAKYLDGTGIEHQRSIKTEREGGDGQDMALAYLEQHVADPKLNAYARPELVARVLGYALGAGTVTSSASTLPYTHELWPGNEAALLTYEEFAPGNSLGHQVIDSKITKVTISGEHGGPVKVETEWMGGDSPRNRDTASARTPTVEAEPPFYFDQASVQVAIGGAYAADDSVTKWSVSFTRGVNDTFGVGYARDAILETTRDVQVTYTRRYQTGADHRTVNYGSGSYISGTVATGAFKVDTAYGQAVASALRQLSVEVPLLVWQAPVRNTFEVDGNMVFEDWTGVALKGATHLIRAQVKNALPTAIASGLL